jgi:ubiquitin-activating enzyme E1-like protein 2
MGTKGHVQVIVPHLTESYTSQQDPADEDYPYCTVKSFPATIEHCIQWARDKFEDVFVQQPNLFNKFLASNADMSAVVTVSTLC